MDKKKKDYEYGTLEYAEGIGKEYADMNYDSFKQGEEYSGIKKGYEQSGQKAMKDTIGQMAAKTGGLASSYAQTAGQQAYGDWMSRLEDAAYSMYGAQKQDKYNEYTLAQDAYKNRKAVADEEELKAKELKTQNENKLWMKFALGQLTPETMTDEDYATYDLTPEDVQTVYDSYLYQTKDATTVQNKNKLFTQFALGKTPDTFMESDWDFSESNNPTLYGFSPKDIRDLYDEYRVSLPAQEYPVLTPTEIMNMYTGIDADGNEIVDWDKVYELMSAYNYMDDSILQALGVLKK